MTGEEKRLLDDVLTAAKRGGGGMAMVGVVLFDKETGDLVTYFNRGIKRCSVIVEMEDGRVSESK